MPVVVIEYEHIPYHLRITNRHLIDRANGRMNTQVENSGAVLVQRAFTAETKEEEELVSLMEEMFDE